MRDISIKMILLGISFLIFSLFGTLANINGAGGENATIAEGLICVLGVFLLPAGLIICIAAIFVKK